VMCPSFQATREEMHSTRGRANLLRALLLAGPGGVGEEAVYEAIDLCLACKGCRAECPSGVDMARLKTEFLQHYYSRQGSGHRRRLRDYLFGYIHPVVRLAAPLAGLVNWMTSNRLGRRLAERWFGLAAARPFPKIQRATTPRPANPDLAAPTVLLLSDTFNHYFYPQVEASALALLAQTAQVQVIPLMGAGRTLISKGFLKEAKQHAARLVRLIEHLDPRRVCPVVGLEPSEIYTLKDEFLDFFPADDKVRSLASRAWMLEEYLLRPNLDGSPRRMIFRPLAASGSL